MQSTLSATVATYSTLSELGVQLNGGSADLVILSLLEASSEARANTLKDLSEFASDRPIIALVSTNDVGLARAAIGYGAKGFIPVTMGFEIAIEVMRFVLAGGTYVPPDHLLAPDRVSLQAPTTLSQPTVLTSRELAAVRAIQEGKSNKVIGPTDVASGKDREVRAIAAIPLRARNRLHRPKRKTLPRIEAAFAQIATAHSSGIPALRRPSYDRSLISTKRGSAPCFAARDIRCAFHAAIVLNDAVEGAR